MKKKIYDTIYHEHLDYHTFSPLYKCLKDVGFNLFNVDIVDSQGGSLRIYCQKSKLYTENKNRIKKLINNENKILNEKQLLKWTTASTFYKNKIRKEIFTTHKLGGKVYGYGAPTKTVLTCKLLDLDINDVYQIIEDNSLKVGKFVPKYGIPIVSKTKYEINCNDLILCFAWNFIDNILINLRKKFGSKIKVMSVQNGKVFLT